ncbi:MAG: hypothetical protein AB7O67_16700 [Vicinamibacterales bacterium]
MARRFLAGGRRPTRQGSPTRRRPVQHEKGEQANGVRLLLSMGAKVYTLGTRRSRGRECPNCGEFVAEHQGTRQTPGIADVFAFLKDQPTMGQPDRRRALWWEVKRRDGGRLSAEQQEFRDLCAAASTDHVAGDVDALVAYLVDRGFLRADRVPHYRLPAGAREGSPCV